MNWKVVLREDRLSKLEEEMNSKKINTSRNWISDQSLGEKNNNLLGRPRVRAHK